MKNQQISKFLSDHRKMYIQMNDKELSDFFSKGLAR